MNGEEDLMPRLLEIGETKEKRYVKQSVSSSTRDNGILTPPRSDRLPPLRLCTWENVSHISYITIEERTEKTRYHSCFAV